MGSLDFLAKGFLAFGHPTLIVPFLIIGFLLEKSGVVKNTTHDSPAWLNACLLILFTMIFNAFLKSLFLVPLNPALGKEGFAFPSGHMQVSVVFYGRMFWVYPYGGIRGLILMILTGMGYGLIQQGYHTFEDVGAAAVVGILTLYGFVKVSQLSFVQKNPARLGLCLLPLVGLMMGVIHYRISILPHTLLAFIGFVGISLIRHVCSLFKKQI